MARKTYSEQFKRDAVCLVVEEGYTINAAAQSVGVTHTAMSSWVDRYGEQADRSKRSYASKDDELEALREENRRLRMEREILKKSDGVLRKRPVRRYVFMKAHQHEYPVRLMAKVLEVSTSGFYGWLRRTPSERAQRREDLAEVIVDAFRESDCNYGSRKIAHDLVGRTVRACRNTIARLMREMGLHSRAQKRKFVVTTNSAHDQPVAKNHLDRDFNASRPNEKWVADITYLRTRKGWVYLAAVMDLFSRRIVGWDVSQRIDTALIESALRNALANRSPNNGLLHHSDRGCQYASSDYRDLLERHGIECSMSRRGNCWDNAPMERFFGSVKGECMNHQRLTGLEHARRETFRYIEIFYNRRRRHQALGYVSPADYEDAHRSTMAA